MPQSSGSLTIAIPAFAHPTEKLPLKYALGLGCDKIRIIQICFSVLKEASEDDTIKIVALTGAGDYYSSGNDLTNFQDDAVNMFLFIKFLLGKHFAYQCNAMEGGWLSADSLKVQGGKVNFAG